MIKQFRKTFLLACLMILAVAPIALAQERNIQEKAAHFISLYNKKAFLGATTLFNFPADYSNKELREDKNAISKTLNMFYEEFGKIASIEKIDNLSLYYFVTIGGGNFPYWQKYPDVYNSFYKVKFSREGKGYVVLVFCHISDRWEIRQVNYGLPADQPKSQERILDINKKFMKLMGQ